MANTFTVDMVTDNGDNSLTITGHSSDNTSYTTSAGRKSDLPTNSDDQMAYYQQVLVTCLPPETPVLYQNPDYTPPVDEPPTSPDDSDSGQSED